MFYVTDVIYVMVMTAYQHTTQPSLPFNSLYWSLFKENNPLHPTYDVVYEGASPTNTLLRAGRKIRDK